MATAPANRKRKKTVTKPYSERIRETLASLRQSKNWTMKDLQAAVADAGTIVPLSTMYGWERDPARGGNAIPDDHKPAIGIAYGFDPWIDWMPK